MLYHIKLHFPYEIKRYFLQSARHKYSFSFMNFLSFSFLTMILMLNPSSQMAATAAMWISIYISSNSAFSCNVMTSLCFLVMLPSALVALLYGSCGVPQGLWPHTKHDEKYLRTLEDHCLQRYTV